MTAGKKKITFLRYLNSYLLFVLADLFQGGQYIEGIPCLQICFQLRSYPFVFYLAHGYWRGKLQRLARARRAWVRSNLW